MTTELLLNHFSSLLLCCCAAGCGALLLLLITPRLRLVSRRVEHDSDAELPDEGYPTVSVVVSADDEASNLKWLLPEILKQDYPAAMEVIVVDTSGGSPDNEALISQLQVQHPNLYMTFAPQRVRNLSRKKLAVTLGVKAAKNDVVVLTNGNCCVPSQLWLRSMCRHFSRPATELVIGYSRPVLMENGERERASRRRAFDSVRTIVQYFFPPLTGKRPVRADGNNMAYRRSTFYVNKGFWRTFNLIHGDDDIFIREIGTAANTAVELSRNSRVDVLEYNLQHAHTIDKVRREFTWGVLGRGSRMPWAFCSWLSWGWMLLSAVAVALPLVEWVMGGFQIDSLASAATILGIVTAVSLLVCTPLMRMWRTVSVSLGRRPLLLTVPWLMLWHPLQWVGWKMMSRRKSTLNYTRQLDTME